MKKYINQTRGAQRAFTEASVSEIQSSLERPFLGPLDCHGSVHDAAASGGQRSERVGSSCIVDPPQHKKVTYLKMSAGLSLKNHITTLNILFFSLNL